MEDTRYNDHWHSYSSDCASNCHEEASFVKKISSCAVCVGNFVSTVFKAIFKV